jgi:hypothetical protein
MGVPQGHADGAVTQKITHRVQRGAVLNETRGKVMAQIVPPEVADPGAREQLSPPGPKSGGHLKDARSSS